MVFHIKEEAQDYKRLLLDFADATGQLDQLDDYINDLALEDEFPSIDFNMLKFELNQ